MLSFLGQYRMVLCEFNACTCRPSGALSMMLPSFYKPAAPLGLRCVGFRDFIKPCNQYNAFQERET